MKKLILAFVGLAIAFAISSCCDQSQCPGNLRCDENYRQRQMEFHQQQQQYAQQQGWMPGQPQPQQNNYWNQQPPQQSQERQYRRW